MSEKKIPDEKLLDVNGGGFEDSRLEIPGVNPEEEMQKIMEELKKLKDLDPTQFKVDPVPMAIYCDLCHRTIECSSWDEFYTKHRNNCTGE